MSTGFNKKRHDSPSKCYQKCAKNRATYRFDRVMKYLNAAFDVGLVKLDVMIQILVEGNIVRYVEAGKHLGIFVAGAFQHCANH